MSTPTAIKTPDVEVEKTAQTNGEAEESVHVKDLQKQIRNITKKLNLMMKVDTIILEHPNLSLEELVATKKINADQKAQAMKKPGLQTQLNQLEQQIVQYKKVESELISRFTSEKEEQSRKHDAHTKEQVSKAEHRAVKKHERELRKKFRTISQFLNVAAAKRNVEEEAESEESKAFEGVLLLLYGGDDQAVEAVIGLVDGHDKPVPSVEGQPLNISYSQLKELTIQHAPYAPNSDEDTNATETGSNEAGRVQQSQAVNGSDPTIVNAGLTEIMQQEPQSNKQAAEASDVEPIQLPSQVSAGNDGANAAATQAWEATNGASEDLEESFEIIPRNPAETEAVHAPAASSQTISWADDAQAAAVQKEMAPANDGFSEVTSKRGRSDGGRGRGRGRGGFRGGFERGGRGSFRGGDHHGYNKGHGKHGVDRPVGQQAPRHFHKDVPKSATATQNA